MAPSSFTAADLDLLAARGISEAEALRQLALMADPPAPRRLDRPCTVGDGIERIPEDETEALIQQHEQAMRQGRVTKFVPASGAATRMFQSLLAARGGGDRRELARLVENLPRFAFHDALVARLGETRDGEAVAAGLLDEDGLGYAQLPKGLLAFHRYSDGPRTPFEEHLVEAAAYTRDARDIARAHFTVSPEHIGSFRVLLESRGNVIGRGVGARFEVGFSVQKPSTDTLAGAGGGGPFRDAAGRLVLRPSGHGALLDNVIDLEGDVVVMKNIDNVVPDRLKGPTLKWNRVLGGFLVTRQREVFLHVARLRDPRVEGWALAEAEGFASRWFRFDLSPGPAAARRLTLLERLERPLRVAGVVKNTGEPGGGPMWVRGADGTVTPQIIEPAEIDRGDPGQAAVFAGSTHFNPVDLACGVRDVEGRPFDLGRFVDPSASIVTVKSHEGRELRALERPGLWNGAMAFWNTIFVEIPLETFAPVKTIWDLLRPEHQ